MKDIYYLQTKEQGDKILEEYGVTGFKNNRFTSPGWYNCYCYQQSCPNGCCQDTFIEIIPIQEYLNELRNKIRSLNNKILNIEADIITLSDKYNAVINYWIDKSNNLHYEYVI